MSPTVVAVGPSPTSLRREIDRFLQAAKQRADHDTAARRRASPRHSRSWPLLVSVSPNSAERSVALYNASDQGVAFLSTILLDPGSVISVRHFWHDEQPVPVPAVVRHATPTPNGYLIGCEYLVRDEEPPLDEELFI